MKIRRAQKIAGTIRVPGDKSIAHRALLLSAAARGTQLVSGLPTSADVQSTLECLVELGLNIETTPEGLSITSPDELRSAQLLFAGNSGTTARLISGIIAGHAIEATIDGDASLRKRPMERIAVPLREMGAEIETAEPGTLPMRIRGGGLSGISYRLPVSSAQVKSAILIAGLFAEGQTVVHEPVPTRDHTERMLASMGAAIQKTGNKIVVAGGSVLGATNIHVPGDLSSAAFLIVAACCVPGSDLVLLGVGTNPTRTGLLTVLKDMGASIETMDTWMLSEEPVSDLRIRSAPLHGATISAATVPSLIDELPVLAVAATQAAGETVVRGAEELKHKESDRLFSVVDNLHRLGANIESLEDGFVVRGPTPLRGTEVSSYGDHRIAMAMAIAGLLAGGTTDIADSRVIGVSYPEFFDHLMTVTT